jgi:ATP phosphoribosyltransferase regulatory subunit
VSASDDLTLPRGFRDILPTEARELHAIERTLMATFESYGYVPLEPPSVEFARGTSSVDEGRLIRFIDREGSLLALRPDLTTAIARVVAQRYRETRGALRLSYFTTVFRQERSMRGSEREYDQAGVELIGSSGTLADAEILALLCESLAAVGLGSFTVEVGHMGAVRALFAGLAPDALERVLGHLRDADHVGAFRAAEAAGLRGDRLERARRGLGARARGIEAVDLPEAMELREAIHTAREIFAGQPLWGTPNLSVIPSLPYYTGIVFEVVSPHVGFPIAMGGRYDGLLAGEGADRPATGFGIAVPHLHQALVAEGWSLPRTAPLVMLDGLSRRDVARVSAALRREGVAVALGAVAETAGRALVGIRVIDDRTVEHEGRRLSPTDLARELNGKGG